MIIKGLAEETLPVYGDGQNVRDWLYVKDHARALTQVLQHGRINETYNIGGRNERSNLYVVENICNLLDVLQPTATGDRKRLISFVTDRPGHDRRYAIDASKLKEKLGWTPHYALPMLVKEMVDADVQLFRKERILKESGFNIKNQYE